MKKSELQQIIKEELQRILKENTTELPIFKKINKLEYSHLNASGGAKTAKALEVLAKKHGLEYASGVYHGAVKDSYDFKYSSKAYDQEFGNTTKEFEKDVMNLKTIMSKDTIGESKKGLTEAPKGKKIKGGITKHFNDYKGTETYNSVRELEDVLMYYAQDPSQPLDLDEIANTVLDIIDYAVEEAIDNYKQSRDEF